MIKFQAQEKLCWFDEMGNTLESEGVDPGNIFEFHFSLSEDCIPGGMVVTNCIPGEIPKHPREIVKVILRLKRDGLIEMSGMRPLVVANFQKIISKMC